MTEEELKQELTFEIDGSNGKHYSVKSSELNDFMAEAKEAGVTLSVTKGEKKNEEPEKWWSWKNLGEGVKGIWDDPTGEHGALAYMGLNVGSGMLTAAGRMFKGVAQGAGDVGFGLARAAARGVESLVGADGHAVSGFLRDWHHEYGELLDTATPDVFEKRGMYDGIEGAREAAGAINGFVEAVYGLKGMGAATKGVTGLAKLAGSAKAAAIGQAVTAAGMGGKTYAEMAEDPDGPGGWRQEAAAVAAGSLEALTFGLMAPFKKMNMAMPKPFAALTRAEIAKRFAAETLKSGAMMAAVEAEKLGAQKLATLGTDQQWGAKTFEEAAKSVASQFMVGCAFHAVGAMGKTGAWLKWRADKANGEAALSFQVEQNRKTYAPIMDRQARLALRAHEVGADWVNVADDQAANVKRVLPSGAVQFDDGSVWQMGKDGHATITVSDGTILDAGTGELRGFRAAREAAGPESEEGRGGGAMPPQEGGKAENAALLLDALERGELPTEGVRLDGLQVTETSYKKGTVLDGEWDQAKAPPVIVWVGNDGTRVLITGRSRAAAASKAGVEEIAAHVIREDQGWPHAQAETLDTIENMREGRGTREEIARGVEALNLRSVEDCDRYGIVPERPVLDTIAVANEGSEALRAAAADGTVGPAWAGECAGKLGKRALGEAAERAQATALDMIAGKLPPEETSAAMEAIAELAARKPDYTDREAAEAIRAARERAVGRVAVDADSEMVEMPDGSIKSVAEAKAEGSAQAQEQAAAEGEGRAPARPDAPDRAAEPKVGKDGKVGCARFPEATATRTRSEDGRDVLLVEGLTGEQMMRPENRESAVQFLARLKEMAGDVDIMFGDVSAQQAAEALLLAKRVQAQGEGRAPARQPQEGLVEAGQRLVDGLFGKESGIRVRTGTPEEAEAALREAGETKPIKDAQGQVQGYYHRGKGEVVLFEGADAGTLAHEIGWHAVYHWAEANSPELLLKMNRYAARAPLELKAAIKEVYGEFTGDALIDEIGAGRFEKALGERFKALLAKKPEVRTWWRKVLDALKAAWKGMAAKVGGNRIDLKKLDRMEPEQAIEWLADQMVEGRGLGKGRAAARPQGEGARFALVGKRTDGIEVYSTREVDGMTNKERMREFLRKLKEDYRGRTARFVVDGKTYYARFEPDDAQKLVYGDKKTSPSNKKVKDRLGAAGDIFDLVENARLKGHGGKSGKKSDAHRNVEGWDHFVKTVQVDNGVYDVTIEVRRKPSKTGELKDEFVYNVFLNRSNKKPDPSFLTESTTIEGGPRVRGEDATAHGSKKPDVDSLSKQDAEGNGEIRPSIKRGEGAVTQEEREKNFKDWFGDSKVVNEKGEPLVVYRGAPYDPLAQEADKGVIKPEAYFTTDPEYARRYKGNGGKVGAYYLNIRRPFDIRDPECLKDLKSIYPNHEFAKGKSGALDWGEASIVDGEFLRENFGNKYDGIIYDEGGDPTEGGPKHRGVSYVPLDGGAQVKSATDNIGTFDPGNPDIRYSRKVRDEVYDEVLKAVRAGGQRVAAGKSERTEAGFDAGANLYLEREGQAGPSPDGSMTLAYSEALRLYRALAANAHMPKVLEKMPHLASRDRKGRLRLNAAAFGIVDKSDMEAVKAGLKKDGMFLHEDAAWRLHNAPEEVRAMEEMSNQALAEEMAKLADGRITGKMSGGGRTAVNILAKEIGRLACELPATAGAPQSLKDLRALGMGISKELGDPKGELGQEAREAAKWWREQDPVRRDPTATKSDTVAASELWAEMFGMFLADPVGLEAHAPRVYAKMVEAIAGNEKLSEAWNALRRTRDAEGPHERVMRDIERQWDVNQQQEIKKLIGELDKPIGDWKKRTRARMLLEFHSKEGPAVMWVTDGVKERLAELKRLKKSGKIGEAEYDALAGGVKRELEKINVALLEKQRGGGKQRRYALEFAQQIMDEVAKDGVDLGDLRRYLYAKSVRDGLHQQGKAAALGMDQREADKVLGDMQRRLGADGWAKLETSAKRFQALREQHILDNDFVVEAFGKELVGYWRMNASYVRSERTWTAEEVAAYEEARKDWMARHPGESTVISEIEALMDMHVAKGSGTAGSTFLKPLVGSLKAVKDPLAATLENDLRIVEFAQRNHWACQLAETAKALELEGFAVMEDRGGGGKLRGSERYGSVTYLKDGKRMTLVMPKVVADGFAYEAKSVNVLAKFNRWMSAIYTQYSPRFALRNIWRNRASNANNIAWMGEGRLMGAANAVGMRPIARLATFLLERAAAHLPDRFARNGLMNLLYGSKTNIYYEGEATRITNMMFDPQLLSRRIEEANRLAEQGKTAEAERLFSDIEKCKAAMKLPIFAGTGQKLMGETGKADLDEVMRRMRLDTNLDGTKLKGLKRVKRMMLELKDGVKKFNDVEEARVKMIALLAAEHESQLAVAKGEKAPRSADEITYQVATMSGSPRYENRGIAMDYLENALGPFMNVGMKGAWRTVESMRYDPKSWWTKAAGRIAGRVATVVLWMGGGYKVIANWLRGDGKDEEKNKRADAFERFGKRMSHALANCSDYRLRNYDIVPVGLYGKWSTLAISMPRGDEDRLLMPAVDLLVHGMLGTEKAQEMGYALPTDLNYGGKEAFYNTVFGSGLLPDVARRGILWTVAQDLVMPWCGYNAYNTFTQRTVYNQADVDARWEEPWNMAKKMGKQVWNDVGGQVVMPATTWDEDEGQYEDQGEWALSTAEEGEAGCMPIGGKTIFHALHSIPFLSATASGLITMQNGGNKKIARRLQEYQREENAPLRAVADKVANEVIEVVRKNGGRPIDYGEMLEARIEALGLAEEDKAIVEKRAFSKAQKVIEKMGMEFDPIEKALQKMSTDERMYRRALRQVEAEGWDGDLD